MSRISSLVLMIVVLLSTVTVGCAEKSQGLGTASAKATGIKPVPSEEEICIEPKIDWRNYEWTLIVGEGQSACEDMLAYLKSRPADIPPPTCPEERLPPNKDWTRPEASFLTEEEMQTIRTSIPEEKRQNFIGILLSVAELMRVLRVDITRDGIPETFLAYSRQDNREICRRSTWCAVENEVFAGAYKYQIRLFSDSYELVPMNEEGTQVDWAHRASRTAPLLWNGELVFYKGLPYWLSGVVWGQAMHDDFAHSRMRRDNPFSAIFGLDNVSSYDSRDHNNRSPIFKNVTRVSGGLDPDCRFGYFHRENLK